MVKASPQIAKPDDFLLSLAGQAQKEAAALQGGQRVQFPYLRIKGVQQKNRTVNVVEVVNPLVRDDKNVAQATPFESLRVVILAHTPIRKLQYSKPQPGSDPKLVSELFSVGPKKGAVGVGTAVGGVMAWDEIEQRWPDGFERDHIPYGTNQVKREKLKAQSRHYVIVGLPEEAREAAGSDIAFISLSMSSTYAISVEDASDAEDISYSLLGYPRKDDPQGHKGVLHQLVNRPWQLGLEAGMSEEAARATPQIAIWMNLIGTRIGNVPTPVHGFELGDELTREELQWAHDAQGRAIDLLKAIIEQEVKDAYPAFNPTHLPRLAEAAVANDWGTVGQALRLGAPQQAEIVEEEAPIAEAEDLGVATVAARVQAIDDEFPPEEDLPF